MVNNYQNNRNFCIDLKNILNYLNNIAELISKPPKKDIGKIINKRKVCGHNSFNNSKIEINKKINHMYQNMDDIALLLKENEFFHDEYYDFREIQDMIKDTLNMDFSKVTFEDLGFILGLIRNFSDLISYKSVLAENESFNNDDYKLKHKSYFSNLNQLKTYFYNNISDESISEESFLEYSNIIMG